MNQYWRILLVALLAAILVGGILFLTTRDATTNLVMKPTPTPERVTIVVYATPEPTPEPTAVPTAEPTLEPTAVPTAEPTSEPTAVLTAEPTPEPTPVSTPTSTPEPTSTPTPEPTPTPTPEPTPTSTPVPMATSTLVPTQAPVNDYAIINQELGCLVMAGGIYPDYDIKPGKDIYDFLQLKEYKSKELFEVLVKPFVDGIATWTDMSFDGSLHGVSALAKALESCVDKNYDRVRIVYHEDNPVKISTVFEEIRQAEAYEKANALLLDWLYNYTTKNPSNPWERLIVATN